MAQASIYWDMRNYSAIEKIFRKSVEFCSDHDVWRLNVGHVLFMQDNNKYRDAIGFYEPIVKKHYDHVINQILLAYYPKKLQLIARFIDIRCESGSFGKSLRRLYNDDFK